MSDNKEDNIEFKSKDELYKRIFPALESKAYELRRLGYKYVKEKDIWNYMIEYEWKDKQNLELHSLVSDILYMENDKINEYIMAKINKKREKENDKIL